MNIFNRTSFGHSMLTTCLFSLLVAAPTIPNYEAAWAYAEKFKTQALLVMVDGKVTFERYENGGGPNNLQAMASGTKSICSVVAAAAVADGILEFDERASDTFIEWKTDVMKSKITVRHLLSLTSGMPVGVRGRLAGERDGWEAAKAAKVTSEPGSTFAYGPNSFNIFGSLLETKLKTEDWETYLNRRILSPLGIKIAYRGRCADGKPQLAGGAWITAKDWITFGEFVRKEGNWKGRQIIPANLMKQLYRPSKANPSYGMSWWLASGDERKMMSGNVAVAANDFRMAAGAGKQRLYIIPQSKIVALRMGRVADGARGWDDLEFLKSLSPPSSTKAISQN